MFGKFLPGRVQSCRTKKRGRVSGQATAPTPPTQAFLKAARVASQSAYVQYVLGCSQSDIRWC